MAKHKYIKTPEAMWKLFQKYTKHTKDKPFKRMDFKGKFSTKVYYELERCLTLEGFENFVADIPDHPTSLDHYFANADKKYEKYLAVCLRIRKSIRQDQIEGGMSGVYNPSITQRLNGLVDKQEIVKHKVIKGIVIE